MPLLQATYLLQVMAPLHTGCYSPNRFELALFSVCSYSRSFSNINHSRAFEESLLTRLVTRSYLSPTNYVPDQNHRHFQTRITHSGQTRSMPQLGYAEPNRCIVSPSQDRAMHGIRRLLRNVCRR